MKYSLVGVDGNAFSIMAYVRKALRESGHKDMIDAYIGEAMKSDYNHLVSVSCQYVDIANGSEAIK